MTSVKKMALWLLATVAVLGVLVFCLFAYLFSRDDTQTGLQRDISFEAAEDCPFILPVSASNIYYAYELYWQGGAMVCRYTYPDGDIQKQAETHLKLAKPWKPISLSAPAVVPDHRFMQYDWFQPSKIGNGVESETTGILWEPKVWIDTQHRYIYIINQN